MKKTIHHIAVFLLFITVILTACYEDGGNYVYTDIGELQIDTTGMVGQDYFTVQYGDTLTASLVMNYDHPQNLKYAWVLVPFPYEEEIVGNTTQFPAPDTIGRSLALNWVVDANPGSYRYYLLVKDTVTGQQDYRMMNTSNYLNVTAASSVNHLVCLSEYEGQTDIDLYYSQLALILSGTTYPRFYSDRFGSPLPGSPSKLFYGPGYYYAFTEQGGYRMDDNELMTMAESGELFYTAPTLEAEAYERVSNNELLLNNGKLHVLNNNQNNDKKFSNPIAGDYKAFPYITKGLTKGLCVIFDEKSQSFLRYYNNSSSMARFEASNAEATVDPNSLPNIPEAILTYDYSKTCAIVKDEEGVMKAYLFNFNSATDGDYSAAGSRSIIDLRNCENIESATTFYAGYTGTSFHYATPDGIYSFSLTSGETTSHKIYNLSESEEVTAIYSIPGGGFPTGGRVYWFAVWDESQQDGKIVEFEIDPNSGLPNFFWGNLFDLDQSNPKITAGFGKIKSMVTGI